MRYAMREMSARSGLTPRTIRSYIADGYLAPPEGAGRGATYGEDQLLRLLVIARSRQQRLGWSQIVDRLKRWSLDEKRAFVAATEPAAADASGDGVAGPEVAVPGSQGHVRGPEDGAQPGATGDALPDGASFVLAPVLPGLSLVVRHDAAPVVRRVAAEILARYAAPR